MSWREHGVRTPGVLGVLPPLCVCVCERERAVTISERREQADGASSEDASAEDADGGGGVVFAEAAAQLHEVEEEVAYGKSRQARQAQDAEEAPRDQIRVSWAG